jgi:LytS/YehU family sensor histidine kinase
VKQVLLGLVLGAIASAIMLTPINYTPGIIFDTRTVLISLAGLFFGPVPALIAMLCASAFRLLLGGIAAWTGVLTIVFTGLLGLLWRHYRAHVLPEISRSELYLFGLLVHIV